MMQSLAVVRTGLEGRTDQDGRHLQQPGEHQYDRFQEDAADLPRPAVRESDAGRRFYFAGDELPVGLQQGTGANVVATEPVVTQGSLEQTGNSLDLAINGQGYFQILQPSGQLAYTRDGSFQISAQGQVVTALGNQLQPPITIPRGAQSITSARRHGQRDVAGPGSAVAGRRHPARQFHQPGRPAELGNNLATQTQASGAAITGQPTQNGLGSVAQGYLEGSNVSVVDEMIDMIATQRAYELNTEAAKGVDQMLNYLTQATS
jgi:flagellar basal-body rod protein FlgG